MGGGGGERGRETEGEGERGGGGYSNLHFYNNTQAVCFALEQASINEPRNFETKHFKAFTKVAFYYPLRTTTADIFVRLIYSSIM